MKHFRLAGAVPALALVTALSMSTDAQASSLLYSEIHDYGEGQADPTGTDVLGADFVTVSDQSTGRFSDSFTFGTGLGMIDRIDVTLAFENSGPSKPFGSCLIGECWKARIIGSDSSGSPSVRSDDFFETLDDSTTPQTISLSAATDTGSINAFTHSMNSGTLGLWFAEEGFGANAFDLDSAKVEAFGSPTPVPVPAALPLLLAGLGGLGVVARRKRKAA